MLLRHGTTRKRAEAILQNGPDANFCEPGSRERAEGFSTAPAGGSCGFGDPEVYARRKASLFPNEGGPAILEFELPDDLAGTMIAEVGCLKQGKAFNTRDEIRFEPRGGLEKLLRVWPQLAKSVRILGDE